MSKPYVSYKYLRDSAKSALIGAIEVYNKPAVSYREETFVVLLVNAWELLLKALLAKNKKTVFYKKKRNEPYRTLSVGDAAARCQSSKLFPPEYQAKAAMANLELLVTYRDNAIHFYNQPGFRVVIYSLAQTSVSNFNELLERAFGNGLGKDLPGSLMPIGLEPPVDPIAFITSTGSGGTKTSPALSEFMREIRAAVQDIEASGLDTGHVMTVFEVHLRSTKKIESADFTVGVSGDESAQTMIVQRLRDPNVTHPYRMSDIVDMKLDVDGTVVKSYQFQALAFHYGWKGNSKYHWADDSGAVQKYSPEVVSLIKSLTAVELGVAVKAYASDLRTRKMPPTPAS